MNRADITDFVFGTYRHWHDGDLFTAIGIVTHHQTRRPMVLYVSHARGRVNCRPLHGYDGDPDGFADHVTWPDGRVAPRFELVKEATP